MNDWKFYQLSTTFSFINPKQLDILVPVSEVFVLECGNILTNMNFYKTPRGKLICIVNCCVTIFNYIFNQQGRSVTADEFISVLIYVILKTNPPSIVSNLYFINDVRSQKMLLSSWGYLATNLGIAINFILNLDPSLLTCDDDTLEDNWHIFQLSYASLPTISPISQGTTPPASPPSSSLPSPPPSSPPPMERTNSPVATTTPATTGMTTIVPEASTSTQASISTVLFQPTITTSTSTPTLALILPSSSPSTSSSLPNLAPISSVPQSTSPPTPNLSPLAPNPTAFTSTFSENTSTISSNTSTGTNTGTGTGTNNITSTSTSTSTITSTTTTTISTTATLPRENLSVGKPFLEMYKFWNCTPDDLSQKDIVELLAEYKRLALFEHNWRQRKIQQF
eukprot:TRINITY_DN7289_c0_g1_i3.p1 TRINITY_DN7289_c0_g1~~TRINITY_DN7289_c0_g1_i3.p1  ORF type:complete len:395 (+),score=111.95 TRINITY_DN7289_c0_g1_i3:241-1425(+)